MSTTNEQSSDLTCFLCKRIYTNPCVISPCGHSFDRECVAQYSHCPMSDCNAPISVGISAPNLVLQNLVDNHNRQASSIYEIFLLDTSTSMWYSDFLFGLIGTSRFKMAIRFLTEVFEKRRNSNVNQISLITFDTAQIEHFQFETVREHHIRKLRNLQPSGLQTGLFDAIKVALQKFETLRITTNSTSSTSHCLHIITDGGDNFSSEGNKERYIDYVRKNSKQLNIEGHVIQVGDKNLLDTKCLCDGIDYHFHHFNRGNAPEFIRSFLLSSNNRVTNIERSINALPDPCSEPVQHTRDRRKTAAYA